jgi:2-methylcitrate dehydratase PrpD
VSGRDLLTAIVAGCEVTTRIGVGLDYPAFRRKGFHGPGVLGPFGGAAAIGRLRGLDAATMARAFGLAGSQAAGTYAAWGTPTVKFHQCRGALSGLLAALLAEQRFRATEEFLTAPDGGLYASYADGGLPARVTADLGRRWEMQEIALRLWPSAALLQGLNTALFDLIERQPIDPAEVKTLRVTLSHQAFDMHGKLPRYQGKFDALISGHYTAAIALADRALTLKQYEPARYDDPAVRHFAEHKVEMQPDARLSGVETVVEIETVAGERLTARCTHPRGAAENPLSRAQVEEKFRIYAADRLAAPAIDAVVTAVNELEAQPSIRMLMELLRRSGA